MLYLVSIDSLVMPRENRTGMNTPVAPVGPVTPVG